MTSTLSPEAFMAQPSEPDEEMIVTGSVGDLTLTLPNGMVESLPGPLHYIADYLRQLVEHFEGTGTVAQDAAEAQAHLQNWREAYDDLKAEYDTVGALIGEIEGIVKTSTSKVSLQVKDAIARWRAPEPAGELLDRIVLGDQPETDHPAHDAGIGIWREYAVREGLPRDAIEGMNRSQIRTALGIEQPSSGDA